MIVALCIIAIALAVGTVAVTAAVCSTCLSPEPCPAARHGARAATTPAICITARSAGSSTGQPGSRSNVRYQPAVTAVSRRW